MAVIIRMRRIGKRPHKHPHFRVSVFHDTRGRDSRFIEEIGYYTPINGKAKINQERFNYWVKNGAQVSPTVKSLMKKQTKEVKDAAGTPS